MKPLFLIFSIFLFLFVAISSATPTIQMEQKNIEIISPDNQDIDITADESILFSLCENTNFIKAELFITSEMVENIFILKLPYSNRPGGLSFGWLNSKKNRFV